MSQAARDPEGDVESIDVAGAFLKGFTFGEIQRSLRKLGVSSPNRLVVLLPPLNVFRHLSELDPSFNFVESSVHNYGLICNKPVYGLNDAPLAWQMCLHSFIQEDQGGERSLLDENAFVFREKGETVAMMTTHVDDIAVTAKKPWLAKNHQAFVTPFGKVTRQQLPFTHCGCDYSRVNSGTRSVRKSLLKS